jgi:predicted DNA binding protein
MRYIENTITPKRGWFHPVDKLVENDPNVERKSIQQINLLEDDTVVMLYELAGHREYIETLVDDHFEALVYSTSEIGDNTLVWAHIEPSSLVERLLRIPQEYNIVLQMPLEFTADGGVKCVFVGERDALREATTALPDAVRVDVRRMGEYNPGLQRFSTELTDRQAEILDAAIELGYYDDPRNATYDDIAERTGCTRTTVGEHLRKIEAKVMPEIRP